MKALGIAGANVRRMFRERSNIFFVFIFPLALILLIGAQFGGGFTPALGLHAADDGSIASVVIERLDEEPAVNLIRYDDADRLTRAVERGQVNAGVFLPSGMDHGAAAGELVDVGFTARSDGFGWQLQSVVASAVAETMKPVGAARFASGETGANFEETLATANELVRHEQAIIVETTALGEALFPVTMGRFDLGAPQQLVLFMFITGLTGASALILTRQLGVTSRMLSTPTSVGTIVVGESLGRFGTSMVQGVYIVVVTLLVFGVAWGDPLGVAAILIVFSAVSAGAAMLMGALFSNAQQAGGIAIVVSLCLAALGGAMVPIETFPPTIEQVAYLTPHAWAISGFSELVRHGGSLVDILPQIGVLGLYGLVLFVLAVWRLRVVLTAR